MTFLLPSRYAPRQIGSDTGAIAALLDPAGARQDRLEAPYGKYIRK
jgi:hypothetical protein